MSQPDIADNTNNITLRLFIAITCPLLGKIADLLKELKIIALQSDGEIRVVADNNLHITLKFLGSLPSLSVDHIAAMLDEVALHTKPFDITLAGADTFRDAFWLGVTPSNPLAELASSINQQLASLGFTRETKPFIPHLTLARINQKARTRLHSWLQQCNGETWGGLHVQETHLYQSETLPTGLKYSILHTSRFQLHI